MSSLVKQSMSQGMDKSTEQYSDEQQQFLTFLQGHEMFAVGILGIKEIIEYCKLTTVPLMPDFMSGVINVRGSVVPVIDLAARFARKAEQATRKSCIVIIETEYDDEKVDIGIIVDSVSEVLEIALEDIEPAPRFGAKIRTEFIQGMGKIADKFVIILNIAKVLSIDEMSELNQFDPSSDEYIFQPE